MMTDTGTHKDLVIFHGNCADGFGGAWVFSRYFPGKCDFHAGVYQTPPPDVDGRNVFLVDFSYKRETVEMMVGRANSVTLIDHHKTALEDLAPLVLGEAIKSFSALNRSGAALAWMYVKHKHPTAPLFNMDKMPRLIDHIEDRDLWRFALEGTREIQACVFSHPYDFTVWDQLMLTGTLEELRVDGAAIERKHFKDLEELLGVYTRSMIIGGHEVPVANLPYTMSSDAGGKLAVGRPFAACYSDGPDGRHFSLRSRDDGVDVGSIAKQYGGGGHTRAAGFKVPRDHPLAQA